MNHTGTTKTVTFALALAVTGTPALEAHAGKVSDGVAAYEAGDHQQAESVWRTHAEDSNAEAQFQLGMYLIAHPADTPRVQEGRRWLNRAHEQGHARAARWIAMLEAIDTSRATKEPAIALTQFETAAQAGDLLAQIITGDAHATGSDGGHIELEQAARWFMMATEDHDAIGVTRLAQLLTWVIQYRQVDQPRLGALNGDLKRHAHAQNTGGAHQETTETGARPNALTETEQ